METLQNKIDFTEDTIMKTLQEKLILPWYLLYHMRIPMEIRSQGTAPVKPMTDMEKFPMSV